MPVMISEPVDNDFPNLLICSSNFSDEMFFVSWYVGPHNFIVDLLLLYKMNYPLCVLVHIFLGDDFIG